MNLGKVFAHAFVRKIAFVLAVLFLSWIGLGKAHAHVSGFHTTQAEAYQHCMAYGPATYPSTPGTWSCPKHATARMYQLKLNGSYMSADFGWVASGDCPGGVAVDPATQQCSLYCPGGYTADPWNAGTCLDQQKCLARNALDGFKNAGETSRPFASRCVGGCEFKASGPNVTAGVQGGATRTSGTFEFSGASCAAQPTSVPKEEAEAKPKQDCMAAGSGQSFCLKANGEHCYSASTGRQICWTPRETGQKPDENYSQKRDAGNTPIAPNLNLPNGDTLTQTGTPTTTTTTTKDQYGNVTTITTTTTNYTTTNGTSPGGENQGEPGDGSGGEEGEGNGSSGGGDCTAPPVNTGDPLLSQIATQQWLTRCEAKGRDDGMRSEANALDTDDGSAAHAGDQAKVWSDGSSDAPFVADEGGFGLASSCPAAPEVFGHQLEWGMACDIMGWIGLLVLLMAHAHALYIIMGD
ncbi:hypothetical protein ACFPOA_08530 [Lysobacter niabensis]|uniref:hypothetical protein n=1 Tax=Agrilutibacter niabensis TaxID=380628 RepID=UPI00360DADAB